MTMRGARVVVATLAALGPVTLIAEGTLANGGAFFDFDRTYYVPGEVVTAQTTFSTQVEKSGRIQDGPYYAFLLSSDRWIQAPRIPDDAIPIGNITTTSPISGAATARITFTLPQIHPGPYTLTFCNLPCTHATLGDLVGGSLSVAASKEEALRSDISDRLDARLTQVRQNLAARIRDTEKAQRDLVTRREVQRLADRLTELEARLVRVQNFQPKNEGWVQIAPVIMAGLAMVLAGTVWIHRFRRPIPKTPSPRSDAVQSIPMSSDAPESIPEVDDETNLEAEPARM
jgi:hypothetical protein